MIDQYTVLYCGLDTSSLFELVAHPRLAVRAVNYVPDFASPNTRNPADTCFRLTYRLRRSGRYRFFERALLVVSYLVRPFFSTLYRKYFRYLSYIVSNRLDVVDLGDVKEAVEYARAQAVDVTVVNNWWILAEEVVSAPRYGTVNVHPSRLPQYRGSLPTLWSLKNHDASSAVSYLLLGAGVDSGDLIGQHPFTIEPGDDAASIEIKVNAVVQRTLCANLLDYLDGKVQPMPQSGESSKTAKYYPYLLINWPEEKAEDIKNKVLLYPYLWPMDRCYFYHNGRKIAVENIEVVTEEAPELMQPGQSRARFPFYFVKAADGVVRLRFFRDLGFIDSLKLLFFN